MSLVEAMASELPVVATRIGGMVEIVQEGETGCLVEKDDPEAIATAVIQLLDDEQLRTTMGQNGRQRVRELFDWKQITARLLSLYRGEHTNG